MKKRFVTIITLSTIAAIFGGLIYCGISAFPELLQSEKEKAEIKEAHLEAPNIDYGYERFVKNDEPENVVVLDSFVPTNYDDVVILYDEFADDSVSFIEQSQVAVENVEEVIVEEPLAEEEKVALSNYISIDVEKSAHVVKTHKRNTFVTFKPIITSNKGVLESTLLVTVVVEALSLFSRQKNRFEKYLKFPQFN